VEGFYPRLILDSLAGNSDEAIQIKNPFLRRLMQRDQINNDSICGCNFSLYRQLFMDINSCGEDFLDGSLKDDNDLGIRVMKQGKSVRRKRPCDRAAPVASFYKKPD